MCRPAEIVSTLHKLSVEIINTYEKNKRELEVLHLEEIDLLHELTLAKLNCVQFYKVAQELKKVELKRRERKDENDLLEDIYNLITKDGIENKFNKSYQKVKVNKANQDKRQYCPRVRTDLTISNKVPLQYLKEKLESRNAI